MSEYSLFVNHVPSYFSQSPFDLPVVGQSYYFAITPFPVENPKVPTLNQVYQDIKITDVKGICDIYHPPDTENYDRTKPMIQPNLNQKAYTIVIEVSHKTVQSGLVKQFCNEIRNFILSKPFCALTIIAYGNTVRVPYITKDRKSFSFFIFPDLSDEFPLDCEMIYFEANTMSDHLLKYIDVLEALEPEPVSISLGTLLIYLNKYISDLRTPILFISSDLTQDATNEQIDQIIHQCQQYHLSFNFAFLGEMQRPNISRLIKESSSHIRHYGFEQVNLIMKQFYDLVVLPYARFCCVYLHGSSSIVSSTCIANFCSCPGDRYIFNKIIAGDTIRFMLNIDRNLTKGYVPDLRVVIQYFDANVRRFKRVIPIKLQFSNDQSVIRRSLNISSVVGAAASTLALKVLQNEPIDEQLKNFMLVLRSDYFRDILDAGNYERLKVAANALKLVVDHEIANEILSRNDDDVFNLLSPLVSLNSSPSQKTVLHPGVLSNESALFDVRKGIHLLHIVGNEDCSELFSVSNVGEFPFIEQCTQPIKEANYNYWLLHKIIQSVF